MLDQGRSWRPRGDAAGELHAYPPAAGALSLGGVSFSLGGLGL